MRFRMVITGLVLAVVLALSSGAFAHFAYPGQSETVVRVPVEVTPVVDRCDRFWQLYADAQTDGARNALRRFHADRDCLGSGAHSYLDDLPSVPLPRKWDGTRWTPFVMP